MTHVHVRLRQRLPVPQGTRARVALAIEAGYQEDRRGRVEAQLVEAAAHLGDPAHQGVRPNQETSIELTEPEELQRAVALSQARAIASPERPAVHGDPTTAPLSHARLGRSPRA